MERLAVYCASGDMLARVREWFEKRGVAAHYTTDSADAER